MNSLNLNFLTMKTMETMKTILVTACLALTMVFTSCSNDDDTDNNPALIGVWIQTAGTSETFANGTSQGITTSLVDANNYEQLTIKENGTFLYYSKEGSSSFEDSGTYTISGNTMTIKYKDDAETYNFIYDLKENILVIKNTSMEINNGITYSYKDSTTYKRQ